MALELFNTLSGKIETFQPLEDNEVRMYACGPTVYDYGHIGNFRTFIVVDTLRRFLKQSGYKLKHVMNVTDVDDKIIRNAARDGKTVQEYTAKYRKAFLEDCEALNIEHPELLVNATDHIDEMARFIKRMEDLDVAYKTEDGSYYFRIAKFPEYGKLSKKDFAGMNDGARVDVDEYEKDNARDFALWKAPKPGEAKWDTVIGSGRPGWHIECSIMSMKYLGESFDIHLGGEDLVFPHHENEIAQSESVTHKKFANFWVHSRFLLVEGQKMSKSLGNFFTVRDLILMGHKPSSIRFLLMSVPYRKQLNFTFDGLKQAAISVDRLRNFKRRIQTEPFAEGTNDKIGLMANETITKIKAALDNDLNTAEALAPIFDLVRDVNAAADAGEVKRGDVASLLEALQKFDEIFAVLNDDDSGKVKFAVDWANQEGKADKISAETAEMAKAAGLSDEKVEALVAEHSAARKAKDFKRSDAIRAELMESGIILENTKDGVRWKRK
ncbi:cysteinyl-tRNA synthetase [Candidatus Koribacter versatilis Ellin345]|uniref:Cysteine--tRNA ligase n=1 Tax=Koribacter versatilis (strain Ellin345) TaxID=204669 RepID=SYC_KORVE|nr:cysteine--tRNA ligase [Candidatus Koribacter versatilis]Q1IJF8.1 RecName: Full=Cysteine--tRNA ligase; AltName: Full=Cysteinyl-tRNA synthetase; Short=CysRS [Candidatus Koribacter versatilis Ellin345]ABF42992.1 cysteinyl-tRNA synthetase [Candidatus Koribacter versatilis Ellin345]